MSAGDGTPVGNIVQILLGLAKSYFNIKGKSNASIQVRNTSDLHDKFQCLNTMQGFIIKVGKQYISIYLLIVVIHEHPCPSSLDHFCPQTLS